MTLSWWWVHIGPMQSVFMTWKELQSSALVEGWRLKFFFRSWTPRYRRNRYPILLTVGHKSRMMNNFISSVSFNALHYICHTYYFHCLSACPVCWTLVGQANGPFSLCSIILWPVCHVLKGQKKTDLYHCPVCLFQTGQAAIFKVLSACPVCPVCETDGTGDRQTGHFQCPVCPVCPVMF